MSASWIDNILSSGSDGEATRTVSSWLILRAGEINCTLLISVQLAGSTEWQTPICFIFLDLFGERASFQNGQLQQHHLGKKIIKKNKWTSPVKSAQSLFPQADVADCCLLHFANNSDYCVFYWVESGNELPAHGSSLLFHPDVQTSAVNAWKECLTVWVCLTVLRNNFSINQILPLVSLSVFFFFWLLCLVLLPCVDTQRHSVMQVFLYEKLKCSKLGQKGQRWLDWIDPIISSTLPHGC